MNSRLKTGLAKLRVKILKDAFGKTMPQAMAARILEIPLTTYIAYEKGARRISRRIAEKASATWHVSPDYLMQSPPKGDPISSAGEALTWQDAQQASMTRLFGFDTWNGQRRTTKLAELLFLNIHSAIHQLSWGSYYSPDEKPGHGPSKRYRELKRRVNTGEELSDTERSELETHGKKWAERKDRDFRKLRSKGHEATDGFLYDALAAIREVLDKHNLAQGSLPSFETRYTAILEDVLEDPDARIVYRDGEEIKEVGEFQPVSPKDKTIDFPDAQTIRPDGKVIAVRPMTPEETIKFQSEPPKEEIASKPLTESEIRVLFEPVRKRMVAKRCYTKEEIRTRLDQFRKRQRDAEERIRNRLKREQITLPSSA